MEEDLYKDEPTTNEGSQIDDSSTYQLQSKPSTMIPMMKTQTETTS